MNPEQNQAPVAAPKKSFGAMIGIAVIVVLLIVGALYVWGGKAPETDAPEAAAPTTVEDLNTIETDLSDADVNIDLESF